MTQYFVNVADLTNPETGKTYRQENSEKTHNIPLGALVEKLKYNDKTRQYEDDPHGLRLYVVQQVRDCDQTPLYCLSCITYTEWISDRRFMDESILINQKDTPNLSIRALLFGPTQISGFPEESLKVLNTHPEEDD